MKVSKYLLISIVAAVILPALASCGNKDENATGFSESPDSGSTVQMIVTEALSPDYDCLSDITDKVSFDTRSRNAVVYDWCAAP